MKEKVGDEREIKYKEEAAINSLDIPRNPIYSTFLSSNSETSEPLENRAVVVTMRDETIDNSPKCSEFKHSNFGPFCFTCILFVIASLYLLVSIIHELT